MISKSLNYFMVKSLLF